MREPAFIKQNSQKWQRFESIVKNKASVLPDEKARLFVEITDDLAYARTFYPNSKVTRYLNGLAIKIHRSIYKNKKEEQNRLVNFWLYELPYLIADSHKHLLYAFLLFVIAIFIGVLSSSQDNTFVRLILGDTYVNMTEVNIQQGDPMAVYKDAKQMEMFLGITINNIRVSFMAFAMGIFFSFGTAYILFMNGIMVGAFQYLFYEKGLFLTSFLTIWIHGTLEIAAIIIAGGAGFVMGNSILFPKTYSRKQSFRQGALQGLKIVIGLVPIFIIAGFLEGYVTRQTDMLPIFKWVIIITSALFIIGYFFVYPYFLRKKGIPIEVWQHIKPD